MAGCRSIVLLISLCLLLVSAETNGISIENEFESPAERLALNQCLSGPGPFYLGSYPVDTSKTYVLLSYQIQCEGVIDLWSLYAIQPGKVEFCVFRAPTTVQLNVIGCNAIKVSKPGDHNIEVPKEDQISVRFMDYIGIRWKDADSAQVLSIDTEASSGSVFVVKDITQPYLSNNWQYYMDSDERTLKWEVAISANVVGISHYFTLVGQGEENQISEKEQHWGYMCKMWLDEHFSLKDVLHVMGRYVDWGEQEENVLKKGLTEIIAFCKEHFTV